MHYSAYQRTTTDAAATFRRAGHRATVTSLAGGFYGVLLQLDGPVHVIVCRDLDGSGEWIAWCERDDGERCCDAGAVVLGHVPPRDYLSRLTEGAAVAATHYAQCPTR